MCARLPLHAAEQPPDRGALQPGRRHLPGHLPAQDPHHRGLLRPPPQQEALPAAVGGPRAADGGRGDGAAHRARRRRALRGWTQPPGGVLRGADRLLLLGLRRGVLREAGEAEQPALHRHQEPAARRLLAAVLLLGDGLLLQRGHLPARHLLRLHRARPRRHRAPVHRRPGGGRHHQVRGQHLEGFRDLYLDHRVEPGVVAGAGGPGAGAALRHRHLRGARRQSAVRPAPVRAVRLPAGRTAAQIEF